MPSNPQPNELKLRLTFEWADSPTEPARQRHDPTVAGFSELFYGLNLLYAEAVGPTARHRGRETGVGWRSRRAVARRWAAFGRHLAADDRVSPDLALWPTRIPVPPLPKEDQLLVEAAVMASPLEIVLVIPGVAVAAGDGLAFLRFVKAIEQAWNAPGRIRLEREEIRAKLDSLRLENAVTNRQYEHHAYEGFRLHEGGVDIPDDWDWPE